MKNDPPDLPTPPEGLTLEQIVADVRRARVYFPSELREAVAYFRRHMQFNSECVYALAASDDEAMRTRYPEWVRGSKGCVLARSKLDMKTMAWGAWT